MSSTTIFILLTFVPLGIGFGWYILGPLISGHPPFTSPGLAAWVNVCRPEIRRRWPLYTKTERQEVH